MNTLIITTPHHGKLNPNLPHILSCAEKINTKCDVIVIGNKLDTATQDIATYNLVNNVFLSLYLEPI